MLLTYTSQTKQILTYVILLLLILADPIDFFQVLFISVHHPQSIFIHDKPKVPLHFFSNNKYELLNYNTRINILAF